MKNLAILLLFVTLTATQSLATGRSVRSLIDQQYKRWVSASLSNDVDSVLAILTPDYTLQTFDGKVIPLEKYEVSLRKRKESGTKPNSYSTSIESLTVSGPVATVISNEVSVNSAPDPITNQMRKLQHIHQYRDTWVRNQGMWKLSKTVTLLEKTTVAPN
jgi:hypothetical protein